MPDIRTGDKVIVMTGKEAGKRGTVQRVLRNPQGYKKRSAASARRQFKPGSPLSGVHVVVEGVNIAHRHTKPSPRWVATTASRVSSRAASSTGAAIAGQPRDDHLPRLRQGHAASSTAPAATSRTTRVCSQCGENLTREAQKHD